MFWVTLPDRPTEPARCAEPFDHDIEMFMVALFAAMKRNRDLCLAMRWNERRRRCCADARTIPCNAVPIPLHFGASKKAPEGEPNVSREEVSLGQVLDLHGSLAAWLALISPGTAVVMRLLISLLSRRVGTTCLGLRFHPLCVWIGGTNCHRIGGPSPLLISRLQVSRSSTSCGGRCMCTSCSSRPAARGWFLLPRAGCACGGDVSREFDEPLLAGEYLAPSAAVCLGRAGSAGRPRISGADWPGDGRFHGLAEGQRASGSRGAVVPPE